MSFIITEVTGAILIGIAGFIVSKIIFLCLKEWKNKKH